jgi:hypothetical protein
METPKKCISVNLTNEQLEQVKSLIVQTGKSQNAVLTESILNGLKKFENSHNQLFWVRVRIDPSKMLEFGQKLQSGELRTTMIKFTYCLKSDPAVGISLWEAKDENQFYELLAPHKEFYKEIIQIEPAIKADEAMMMIMKEMN